MLILMMQVCISKYLGSGPMWANDGFNNQHCKDTWWWNLLYINNFKTAAEEVNLLVVGWHGVGWG